MALGPSHRERNHVGGNQIGPAYPEVKPIRDDVDQTTLGDEVDMHSRIAPDKFEHERGHDLPRARRERIDAQNP